MILETSPENLRDIAAALNAAIRREPTAGVLGAVQTKVISALRGAAEALELDAQEAQALRNALLHRAYDQRDNTEGLDYSDIAERIARALEDEAVELPE